MKLDLGCGPHKKEGFLGVDQYAMDGVDIVADLREPWPFEDNSVEEIHCSHFLEHLTKEERVHFANEVSRVLKSGGKATIICPSWSSNRAYGDPTHQWPPMAPFWFFYLSQEWRDQNAPHTDIKFWDGGFSCDLNATWGYGIHPHISTRNQEFQEFAVQFYIEAVQDIHATLTKK